MDVFNIKPNQTLFPKLLKEINSPPKSIFYKGDIGILNQRPCIAIVGTRNATPYGEFVTDKIITELSFYDVVIVSGLAKGIDTLAHRSALNNNLLTVAVLPGTIEAIYPPQNKELAEEIVSQGGALVTEEARGAGGMKKYLFAKRNRLISGLCLATVIVEAPEKSGALITAREANNQGREVFIVPADIDRESSAGCLKLLKNGEASALDGGHLLMKYLKIEPKRNSFLEGPVTPLPPLSTGISVTGILKYLYKTRGKSAEELSHQSNLPINKILSEITFLQLEQKIKEINGLFYLA